MSEKDPAHSVHTDRRAAAIEAETKPPPAPVAEPELEWKKVQTQVSPPDERSCGVIIEGSCAVRASQLHVRDHEGREWTVPLAPDDNPEIRAPKAVAREIRQTHRVLQPDQISNIIVSLRSSDKRPRPLPRPAPPTVGLPRR
jgi:hypothetical protein